MTDYLGSTRAVIDDAGLVQESHDYYPFGLQMPGRSLNAGTKELFTGKERDTETGWDYFGARYYDPVIGRWLSADPLAVKYPSVSPYIYVNNNPIALKDVNGEYWISALRGRPAVLRYPVPVAYAAYGAEWVPLAGGILNLFRRYGFTDFNVSGSDIGLGFLGGRSLKFVGQTFRRFANGAGVADAALLKAGLSSAVTPFDRGVDAIISADLVSQSKRDVLIFALAEALGFGTQEPGGAFGVFLLDRDLLNDPRRKFDPIEEFEKLNIFFKLRKEEFIELHGKETYNKFQAAQRNEERGRNREQEFNDKFDEFSQGGR